MTRRCRRSPSGRYSCCSCCWPGSSTTLLVGVTLAAAEAATRHAFPRHLDWWKLWRYRGTREVASRVGGGYAVAAIACAYVAAFYVVTRTLFGWWVPSTLLDDPNQIATPMPWITGIALSANAAVWEEALFRALPLSLVSVWAGRRPGRRWWMAAGVVGSALIFGFAHSNYESWPPYSRGVEIFLDACFWAILFIQFGLVVTVIAHFVYDAVLFGLFAAAGDALEYRVTAAIIAVAVLAPALAVLWRAARQRGLTPAPETRDSRPGPRSPTRSRFDRSAARGVATALVTAGPPSRGGGGRRRPPRRSWTATRADVRSGVHGRSRPHHADRRLGAARRGGDPAGWSRLTTIESETRETWARFLRKHGIVHEAQRLASSYEPPAWWEVRYVHTAGSTAERAEEWSGLHLARWTAARGRHILADSARRGAADSTAVRRIAAEALARERIDASTLKETEYRERARPARLDVRVTYTDTAVKLPAGAAARVWVRVAGDEPLGVRRGVELPQAFLRADHSSQTSRMVVGTVAILLLVRFPDREWDGRETAARPRGTRRAA